MGVAIIVACPWKPAMNGKYSIKPQNLWVERTKCPIWPTSISIAKVSFWNAARKRDEMLELYDGKLSRTVLRRESGSNPADLAGTIFGGFAPNSQTAEALSKALGSRTVLSGSVSRGKGKDGGSQSLQMLERPLLTPDELKALPKGEFIVMKTGTHPMRTRLKLFLDWDITFGEPYQASEHGQRKVYYAGRKELEAVITEKFGPLQHPEPARSPGRGSKRRTSPQTLAEGLREQANLRNERGAE